jgi:hypothetical protein
VQKAFSPEKNLSQMKGFDGHRLVCAGIELAKRVNLISNQS